MRVLKCEQKKNKNFASLLKTLLALYVISSVFFSTEALLTMQNMKDFVRILILGFMFIAFLFYPKWLVFSSKFFIFVVLMVFPLFAFSFTETFLNILLLLMMSTMIAFLSLKEVSKTIILYGFTSVLVVVVLVVVGILDQQVFIDLINNRIRYSFGFANANYFSLSLFEVAILTWLVAKKHKLVISFVVMTPVLFLSVSRTPIVAYLLFLVTLPVLGFMRTRAPNLGMLVVTISAFLVVVAGMTIPFINSNSLNLLLSLRLTTYSRAIEHLPLHSFVIGGSQLYLDSSYLSLWTALGIPFMTALCSFLVLRVREFFRSGRITEICFMMSFAAYGITEGVLISPALPLTIVFWTLLLYGRS